MRSPDVSFRNYLHREMDVAGKRFEKASRKVMTLTGGPACVASPALLDATQALAEEMRLYLGAIRRLSHYSSHQVELKEEKSLATHA